MSYLSEQDPHARPETTPLTFDETIAQLDAANGQLYLACARYADWPTAGRGETINQYLYDATWLLRDVLTLAVQDDTLPDQAIRVCVGILLTEDRNRVESLRAVMPSGNFSYFERNMDDLVADFKNVDMEDYNDAELVSALMSQNIEFIGTDFEKFFDTVAHSNRARVAQTTEIVTQLAIEGAKVGFAAGVGILILKSLKGRPA